MKGFKSGSLRDVAFAFASVCNQCCRLQLYAHGSIWKFRLVERFPVASLWMDVSYKVSDKSVSQTTWLTNVSHNCVQQTCFANGSRKRVGQSCPTIMFIHARLGALDSVERLPEYPRQLNLHLACLMRWWCTALVWQSSCIRMGIRFRGSLRELFQMRFWMQWIGLMTQCRRWFVIMLESTSLPSRSSQKHSFQS